MKTVHFLIRVPVAGVYLWTALAGGESALGRGRPGIGIVQPKNYVSPSGGYSLYVEPSDRFGRGAATNRLSRNGAELHVYEKPYTLVEVSVTDRGLAAGMAYRRTAEEEEFLHIVILDPTGREILNDVKKRQLSHLHGPTLPEVRQMIVDEPSDRLIVLVRVRSEELWVYELSTGKLLNRLNLRESMSGVEGLYSAVDSRLVPDTPLLLFHFLRAASNQAARDYGAVFALVDPMRGCVWKHNAESDYAKVDLKWVPYLGPQFFESQSAIPFVDAHRFSIRLFSENKEVAFHVCRDDEDGWSVLELGRIDAPAPTIPKDSEPTRQPVPSLEYLGELALADSESEPSPIQDVLDFTFDKNGLVYFRQRNNEKDIIACVDQAGKLIRERSPVTGSGSDPALHWTDTPLVGDDRYLVTRSVGEGDDRKTTIALANLVDGVETPLAWYEGKRLFGIARSGNNRIAYSDNGRVQCVDGEGKKLWDADPSEHLKVLGLSHKLAMLSNGNVAVLGPSSILIYDDGRYLKSVDLYAEFEKSDDRASLGYLHEVVADADGGFLIANSENPPLVARFDAEGKRRSLWSPRHGDGRTFNIRGQVRVSRDGRLWTSDGQSIMRLTDEGVVDLILGAAPQPDRLDKIIAFTIDAEGRMYAASHGTGAVHVFDRSGKRQRVFKPDPTDMAGTVSDTFIAVDNRGDVFIKKPATQIFMPPDTYLHFSADGQRRDAITFQPSIPVGQFQSSGWAFQPKTNYRCGICQTFGDDRLVIVEPPGNLIREVRKRADSNWLVGSAFAMAPDGSMVVVDTGNWQGTSSPELLTFAPNGDPQRTIGLPPPAKRYEQLAYDGKRTVVFDHDEVLVVDMNSGEARRFALTPPQVIQRIGSVHIRPHADELILFDRPSGMIHRYAVPPLVAREAPVPEEPVEAALDPADAEIKAEWVKQFMEIAASLPDQSSCTLYYRSMGGGSETLTAERVAALPENEREGLKLIDMSDCGIRFDSSRVFARMLDILAEYGISDVDGQRVLDMGCCDLRPLQALARLGARVTGSQAGYSLTTMCNDWHDVGGITGPDGRQGSLEIIGPGRLQGDDSSSESGRRFDLVLLRNLVHKLSPDDFMSSEPWTQTGITYKESEFLGRLFGLLAPGGKLLTYDVDVEPTPAENAFARNKWEAAGFQVLAFDRDDRGAAVGIGEELGWEAKSSPLRQTVRARFTVLQRRPDAAERE